MKFQLWSACIHVLTIYKKNEKMYSKNGIKPLSIDESICKISKFFPVCRTHLRIGLVAQFRA